MFTLIASAATKYTVLQDTLPGGANDLLGLIDTITNWLFTILLALAVFFLILAAYKYLFSGGGEEVGKAHKMILYAAVAIAVAVLAKGVVNVTKVLVSGKAPEQAADKPSSEYKFIGTSPSGGSVSVFPCQDDGSLAGVRVDGNLYGLTLDGTEKTVGLHASNPEISVTPCKNGSIPNVIVDGVIYGPNGFIQKL